MLWGLDYISEVEFVRYSADLRDPIDEHAKMHELGIAHGHGGNKDAYQMSGKLNHLTW